MVIKAVISKLYVCKKLMKNINKKLTFSSVLLVILGIIAVEYLRPKYEYSIFLGSLPNFVGAFVLYNLVVVWFFNENLKNRKFWLFFLGGFLLLFFTIEEYYPFFTASKTFDFFDIIASAFGVLSAYLSFELFVHMKKIGDDK